MKDIVNHYDWHATLLHLFGLDWQRLTYKRAAAELSLVNGQPAQVIKGLLA